MFFFIDPFVPGYGIYWFVWSWASVVMVFGTEML